MKNTRKGFTLVELVIVIAVIAILAGVLIATFASVIKRANQSAEVQNIKNAEIAQKADDIIKKIEEANWFGWEDFEADIVAKITSVVKENPSSFDATALNKVVEDAIITALANKEAENTDLTAEQVEAIVANALGTLKFEGVTEAQVRAIVNSSAADVKGSQLTAAQVKMIVNAANENNLTAAQVAEIVGRATFSTPSDIESAVTTITTALTSSTAGLATSAQVEELKELIEETAQAVQSQDIDDVITAKSLNIRIKNAGLTSANYPYQVFEHIGFEVVPDKSTILLSIENGQLGFFVVNSDRKVVNPCGLTIDVNADDTVVYKYWIFANTVSDTYSTYLTADQTEAVEANGVGVDVGDATVSTINYGGAGEERKVVIRTNSFATKLTVNASTDTVTHYGYAYYVDVQAIKGESYHESGIVGRLKLTSGHAVIEKTGTVYCAMDTDGNATTATIANNGGTISAAQTLEGGNNSINAKGEDGVATALFNDCGYGHHNLETTVIDSEHVYNICSACGYIVIVAGADSETGEPVYHTSSNTEATANVDNEEYSVTEELASGDVTNSVVIPEGHTHSFEKETLEESTCSTHGVVQYTCSCGIQYTAELPFGNHTHSHYAHVANTNTHISKCGVCGETFGEAEACDTNGQYGECSKCFYHAEYVAVTISGANDPVYYSTWADLCQYSVYNSLASNNYALVMLQDVSAEMTQYVFGGAEGTAWYSQHLKGKAYIFDLYGKYIDLTGTGASYEGIIQIKGGNSLTIRDSSASKNGILNLHYSSTGSYGCIDMISNLTTNADDYPVTLNVESGTIIGSNSDRGTVFMSGNPCRVNVSGGSIQSLDHCAIVSNQTYYVVNLTGGKLIGASGKHAIAGVNKSNINITGGKCYSGTNDITHLYQ